MNLVFIFNSVLLGIALAMDAFSICLVNGMMESNIKKPRMLLISGTYGFFQFLMPMIGWSLLHTLLQFFTQFSKFIPYISLFILVFLGIKFLLEGFKTDEEDKVMSIKITFNVLILQGIATSIDALSVGITIAEYSLLYALISSLIIGLETWGICIIGLIIGKTMAAKIGNKAIFLSGIILILIGLEIFIKSFF